MRILRRAQRDISAAHHYLESQRVGSGRRFLERLDKCFDDIARNPTRYALAYKHYRQGFEPKFGFIVYYAYSEWLQDIVIHAVVHAARDQETILSQLPP